jgi:hypothetical protein
VSQDFAVHQNEAKREKFRSLENAKAYDFRETA